VKISLIVTTYNWPEALELTLRSALAQSLPPHEVIVADDGSKEPTRRVVESFAKKAPFPLLHSWQKDDGFRLAMSRNRAIARATGEYVVVVDGDMVLQKDFLADHADHARPGLYLQGGRVLLGPSITRELFQKRRDPETLSLFSPDLKNRKNALRSPLLCRLFSKTSRSMKGIKGCNFSLFREDILRVNGFDNAFVGWGREDSEFVARLYNAGLKRKNLKFCAVAYHLFHPEHERDALPENDRRLRRSVEEDLVRCEDGIERFTTSAKEVSR